MVERLVFLDIWRSGQPERESKHLGLGIKRIITVFQTNKMNVNVFSVQFVLMHPSLPVAEISPLCCQLQTDTTPRTSPALSFRTNGGPVIGEGVDSRRGSQPEDLDSCS